jgi:hypothetical protein
MACPPLAEPTLHPIPPPSLPPFRRLMAYFSFPLIKLLEVGLWPSIVVPFSP